MVVVSGELLVENKSDSPLNANN